MWGRRRHLLFLLRRGGVDKGNDGTSYDGGSPWMGLAGLWMVLLGLSMGFRVFYLINRGGQATASEKISFTVTFGPWRLACSPRLTISARLG